jgi:hypothetical protein
MVSHAVTLRGLGATARAGALILQRTDDDFIESTLDECRDPALTALRDHRARDTDSAGTLRLFQPVHRTIHLAMFEVVCDRPGQPRLAPADILGAGMVIRRVASSRPSGAFGEAWLTDKGVVRGWVPFGSLAATQLDPDPRRRRLADQGQPAINARLREVLHGADVAEDVMTLHVLPPDVCADAARTMLFGLVPTVSLESAAPPAIPEPPYDADEIAENIPRFLRAGKPPSLSAIAGASFSYETADTLAQAGASEDNPSDGAKQLYGFVQMLRVLTIQLDAFGETKDAETLRKKLEAITLTFPGDVTNTADKYLAAAAEALVLAPSSGKTITIPKTWPQLTPAVAAAIRTAFGTVLQARFASFVPRATRFDDPEARYRIHGFVRVRRDDGCPPDLVWCEPSAPYRIVPWYENGNAPPVLVRLPPLDRKNIRKLKPNVSFVVPKSLFCLLNRNSPKNFLEGKGKECSDEMLQGGIDWICGFNIPIITLCAFIVLFIFLTLFHIIFWWLPFIRICFPLPRKAKELLP